MSQFWCTSCNQFFTEEGFCPFDGNKLTVPPPAASSQPETLRASSASGGDQAAVVAAFQPAKAEYDKLVGQTLDGRYKIERKIGEGGMGVVFAARHAVIERPLAIKVLKREVARDAATIKRFVQEAKAATRIGHPCIVDVTDFGTTPDGMTYSVMEYVDGVTLSSALKRGAPFALTKAVPIIAQIARALGAAHDKGIVHRDLKPENVFLVNRDGRRDFVKIVDFGIAKVTPLEGQPTDGPRLTRAGAVFGTPEYMAPEQAAGRPDTDQRVDVYALGTILYEMLVGRVPHKSDSMVRTLAMQMLDPIEPPSKVKPDLKITPELERVVMKSLAKKREERYPNMSDFVTDLERACPGIPTGVPAPNPGGDGPLQLVPAPPGADPRIMSDQRTVDDGSPGAMVPPKATPNALTTPRAPSVPMGPNEGPRATSKRVAHEPRFVTSQRPMTFEHVFDDEAATPRRRSRWPLFALVVALAAGGGIAAALILRDRGSSPSATNQPRELDAAPKEIPVIVAPDGGAAVPPDAGVAPDAAPLAPDGGPGRVHPPPRDAGVKVRVDAGVPRDKLTPRGTVAVQVITKPDGASVYSGNSYRGVGGVTIEEEPGKKLEIKCTLPGYDPGHVTINFDGNTEVVICKPVHTKRCVKDLHNPFDDCPEDSDPPPPNP